jgi:Mn-dependent DtxR family transcriptional regulator
MSTVNGLKPYVVKVLEGIYAHVAEHGMVPTYAQLADAIDVKPGTLAGYLSVLEARGWIRRPGCNGPGRGLELTDKVWPVTS